MILGSGRRGGSRRQQMRTYRVVLEVVLMKGWASMHDFEREITLFNLSNVDVMEAKIKEVKRVSKK